MSLDLSASWVVPCLSALVAGAASAQEAPRSRVTVEAAATAARFAEPVVVHAGDRPLGARRLYPSPVFRDMNGDGRLDVVVGDLWGKLTVAHAIAGEGVPRYAADEPVLGRDAKPLDFANW